MPNLRGSRGSVFNGLLLNIVNRQSHTGRPESSDGGKMDMTRGMHNKREKCIMTHPKASNEASYETQAQTEE